MRKLTWYSECAKAKSPLAADTAPKPLSAVTSFHLSPELAPGLVGTEFRHSGTGMSAAVDSDHTDSLISVAEKWLEAGLSVLPVLADKRPSVDGWKELQLRPYKPKQVRDVIVHVARLFLRRVAKSVACISSSFCSARVVPAVQAFYFS